MACWRGQASLSMEIKSSAGCGLKTIRFAERHDGMMWGGCHFTSGLGNLTQKDPTNGQISILTHTAKNLAFMTEVKSIKSSYNFKK